MGAPRQRGVGSKVEIVACAGGGAASCEVDPCVRALRGARQRICGQGCCKGTCPRTRAVGGAQFWRAGSRRGSGDGPMPE
eukprot:8580907-Lingulodinium_polyedra.AAC.1